MYRVHILHGISNLPWGAPMCFSHLETAIATAMALPPSKRAIIESWSGLKGTWVRQMERTQEHCPPEGFGRRKTPPTLRFCRDEAGCTHFPPPDWEPYDGVPADTGSV